MSSWPNTNYKTYNYGGTSTVEVNGRSSRNEHALLKWDLSDLPDDATVDAASITLNVTAASGNVYYLYDMIRTWVEGTNTTGASSSSSANWNTYNGTTSWGTIGARNTTSDRNNSNLWDATNTSYNATGSKTVPLNSSGVAVLNGWLDTPGSNYGVTIQRYDVGDDALIFSSSEAATQANRPKLNIHYCVPPTGPTITTVGTLSAFSSQPGVYSTVQNYSVSGSNLEGDIVITPPSGFEVSTDQSTWYTSASPLTLAQTGGVVDSTTIYVRLYSATEGTFGPNVVHTSTNADTVNVAASGTVLYVYTLTAVGDGHGSVTLSPRRAVPTVTARSSP